MKHISKKYNLVKKYNKNDILKLSLDTIDLEKYKIKKISKSSLTDDRKEKVISLDEYSTDIKYSEIMLYSELAMYIGEISCVEVKRILNNSDITINKLLEIVSQHNNIIYDILVPKIVKHIFEVEKENFTSEKEVLLLKEPEETYYTFKADPELVVTREDLQVMGYENKSFHADAYCFDSKPEKELFLQYIKNDKIKEIYFTGMFTANQTEFYIQYIDPDSKRLRKYYPDFIAKFVNDNYEIIEVKGDNKIDDENVKAKKEAAMEIAVESNMDYTIYKASTIMQYNVLDDNIQEQTEIKENIELSEKTIVDKIKEAKELLDMDIITYDEFEKIKIQLLKK